MRKYFAIFAALALIGMGSANAQQQEGQLHRIELPHADFDVVLVTAKPGSSIDLRGQPDPSVVYLMGGELVQAYIGEIQRLFPDIGALTVPACAFNAESKGAGTRSPVAVYVVPKSETVN